MKLIAKTMAAFVIFCMLNCNMPEAVNAEFGLLELQFKGKKPVYFKRELRGLNFDGLSISLGKDHCKAIDTTRDYFFTAREHPVFYKQVGDSLILYSVSALSKPTKNEFPIPISFSQLNENEFLSMSKNYETMGLAQVNIEIDPNLKCF